MPAGTVRLALAARVCVPELRACEGMCVEVAATAAVRGLSPPVLADQRYDLCGHQAGAAGMVSGDVSADPGQERALGTGALAPAGDLLQQHLVDETQTHAGDEGAR